MGKIVSHRKQYSFKNSRAKVSNGMVLSRTKCPSLELCIAASGSPNRLKFEWQSINNLKFCLQRVYYSSVIVQKVLDNCLKKKVCEQEFFFVQQKNGKL